MLKTLVLHVEFLEQASQQMKQEMPSTAGNKTDKPRKAPRRLPPPPSPRSLWQAQMHRQIYALAAQGKTPPEIRESLHLCRQTVRKYLRMPTFAVHYRGPTSPVEPYRAYLEACWQQGEVMAKRLWEELQTQGFEGTYKSVWAFVHHWPLPEGMTPTSSPSSPPRRWSAGRRSPRQVRWLLLLKAEELSEADAVYRQTLFRLAPPLAALSALGQDFIKLIQQRESEKLVSWLERAKRCPYAYVQSFALGLGKECSAFQAALTEPWSTGQVEGQITRLKLLKRQMYGRANLDLLRLRLLHTV